ncbi:hypothetical protein KKG46_03215, partial [Patescibacteria group bacterium]|nr:hypothetical protein [Patescibacteria group bacterium]
MNSKKRVQKHSKFNIKFYSVALYAKFFVFTCLLGFISLSTLSVDNLLLIPTAYAAQGISHTVNYQGKLMDAVGTPVVDGSYNMRFVIYDASSGGSQLWSASTTNGLPTGTVASFPITVTSGLFSILLGDVSDGQVAFPDNIFNNDSLYLGITIGSDSEMTPRKRLSAVPYAFNSETLQGQYASNT